MKRRTALTLVGAAFLFLCRLNGSAAVFEFVYSGAAETGLQDLTPVAPIGGNLETTLGMQRLNVLRRAGETFGRYLVSAVPIRVQVTYTSLGPSVLAAAGPASTQAGFPNAPASNVFYPIALANSLAGYDLSPAGACVNVTVSSDANFYLGLDAAPAGSTSMLSVILHELAHGLGFISYARAEDAAFPIANMPDVFSTRILDLSTGLRWDQMTSAQRLSSRTNSPNLVWAGASTTAAAPFFLQRTQQSVVAVSLAGSPSMDYAHGRAAFGPALAASQQSRPLVLAKDGTELAGQAARACQNLTNTSEISGRVVLIRRGLCNFDAKVLRAQQAGAVGVIVANHLDNSLVSMAVGTPEVSSQITIPAAFVGKADGDALEAAVQGTTVSLGLAERPAGSFRGRVRLHAPLDFSSGSSISHWSTESTPDLFLEPFINTGLDSQLDLTLTMMKDIGWRVVDLPLPHLSYVSWAAENLPAAITRRAPADDPDGKGVKNIERYFFGLPVGTGPSRLPVASLSSGSSFVRFTRSILPTDLVLAYEKSTDLVSFQPAIEGVDYQVETLERLDNQSERVTLKILGNSRQKMFLRLRLGISVP